MVRRLSFAALLAAVAAALMLPGSAAAADAYFANIKIDHCQRTGGAHGRGYIELKVKAREIGASGTTQFVVSSDFQASSGLGFSTQWSFPKDKSSVFPNDATNYFHVTDRRYDFTKNDELAYRIVTVVKFKNAAGHVITTRTATGSPC